MLNHLRLSDEPKRLARVEFGDLSGGMASSFKIVPDIKNNSRDYDNWKRTTSKDG
jgi:hypothetical protein